MKKLTYILAILILKSLVSCEKKDAAPAVAVNKPPAAQDTVSGKIYTIAGNGYDSAGKGGHSGDGGAATLAELYDPEGVAVDASGNIYIADLYNERIRKVNANGIISTFAGNGVRGYYGDGGPATSAELYYTEGVCVDGLGNVYITDNGNNRIRKVNTNGIISTIAGNGTVGFSGDGGVATSAEINNPYGLAVDASGNVYIADCGNNRVREVNNSGIISTIAGKGNGIDSGDGGLAIASELAAPQGVAVDGSGNIYIADYIGNRIRKINTSGIISTFSGNGYGAPFDGGYSGDGGLATSAELHYPTDVAVDALGNVYFSDAYNDCIRMVNTNGIISTYAGTGSYGYTGDGGPATSAKIGFIQGIALDNKGNLYISDLYLNRVRVVYK